MRNRSDTVRINDMSGYTTVEQIDLDTGSVTHVADYGGKTSYPYFPAIQYAKHNQWTPSAVRHLFGPDMRSMVALSADSMVPTGGAGVVDAGGNYQQLTDVVTGADKDFGRKNVASTPSLAAGGDLYVVVSAPPTSISSKLSSHGDLYRIRDGSQQWAATGVRGVSRYTLTGSSDEAVALPQDAGYKAFVFGSDGASGCLGVMDVSVDGLCVTVIEKGDSCNLYTRRSGPRTAEGSDDDVDSTTFGEALLSDSNMRISSPVFSEDGSEIAFFASDPTGGTSALYTVPSGGGDPTKVPGTDGILDDPKAMSADAQPYVSLVGFKSG